MAITKVELANMLLGVESTKKAAAKIKTSAIVGTAYNDSQDGYVLVDLGGDVISVDGKQYVSLATTADVRAGDKVYVLLRGADGTAMGATVIGSAGGGDRTKVDIAAAAAEAEAAKKDVSSAIAMVNSVKAESDAHESQIDAIQKDMADYKKSATATYATKTEVNDQTGAITKTIEADYTKTADLGSTSAVKDAKAAGTTAQSQLSAYKGMNDAAVKDAKAAGTTAQGNLSKYQTSNDAAVAAAKKAGTDAQSDLDAYKTTVSETYAEKSELTQQVNLLKSTMTANYSSFTEYRTSNDTALSKAQSDATNAQSTIDSYKQSNDRAVADAKSAGTTAQDQLSSYKNTNDAAVAAAKKAGTDAQADLNGYRNTTNAKLDSLQNIADNAIESYYLKGAPTASNPPASSWTTDALKKQHAGDLYMDTSTGYTYRWSGTAWIQVKDSDVTKALMEIANIKTDYATKTELEQTNTSLSAKVEDSLSTAKTYASGLVSTEVTQRNAAITAKANEITQQVSKTYTKSETFSAYQSDADSRIATANSNASTAKSTAQTAATDAATAKTNASTAVSTANSAKSTAQTASTNASNAVSTANSANSKSDSAVSTANSAKSTAASASSTANTAKSTADTAKSTADAVNRAAVKSYRFPGSGSTSKWIHVGDWTSSDSHTLKISVYTGNGYNADTAQNSTVGIFVKDGWQPTASTANAYGATVTLGHLDRSKCTVVVIATASNKCSIWLKFGFSYEAGTYTVSMTPGDTWADSGTTSDTEPAGVKQNVAILVNAEEANAAAGNAQTSANNAQKAADKAQSSADDTAAALAKAAVRIRIDGTPMADGTSQLMAHVYVGNDEVSANAIAKLGTLVWKMDGVADKRGVTTYTAQTGKFVTCRLEA